MGRTLLGVTFCYLAVTPVAAQRPHLPHAPVAGGIFATDARDALHLEAVWSEQRRLRLLVSDATGEPITIDRLRDIEARAIAGDQQSALAYIEAEGYFEARIPTLRLPARIDVWLKDPATPSEQRVSFTFETYSADLLGIGLPSPPEIPGTLDGILTAIDVERRAAQAAVDREDSVAIPTHEGRIREYVLAIDPYLAALPAAERTEAAMAVTEVVRSCWLLHIAADSGYNQQRRAAFVQTGNALDRLRAALARLAR